MYFANNLFNVIINRSELLKMSIAGSEGHLKSRRKLAVINLEKTKCQKEERKIY